MHIAKYNFYDETEGYISGNPLSEAFLVVNNLVDIPADYTDITSIANFDKYEGMLLGQANFKDRKCVQREIKALAMTICNNDINTNWNNLTATEKDLVCKWCLTKVNGTNLFTTLGTLEKIKEYQKAFDLRNSIARGTNTPPSGRIAEMRLLIFNKFGATNGLQIMNDAINEGVLMGYSGGIESFAEDGQLGLHDFYNSTTGTKYDGSGAMNGLSLRAYPVIDGSADTLQDVVNSLNNILNGYY